MSGLLTPLVAVTAMLMSSLTVIANTVLLVAKNETTGDAPETASVSGNPLERYGRLHKK